MTASSMSSLSYGYTALALFLSLVVHTPAHGDDWTTALEQALALDNDGYTFLAIEQLETLEHDHEEALRLKLELAALHLKVGQLGEAALYINEVLSAPNLPVKVRINAQMLQLKIQTAQNAPKQQVRTSLSLSSGYEADKGTPFAHFRGAARLTRQLKTLDISGRPLPTQFVFNTASIVSREFETANQPWLLKLDTGLALTTGSFKLSGGAGYQLSSAPDGPFLFMAGGWRKQDWSLRLTSQWLYPGDSWETSHRLGLQRTINSRWRLSGKAHYRSSSYNSPSTVIGVGQTLRLGHWHWQAEVEQELDKGIWTGDTGVFWYLGDAWRLGANLGTEDFSRLENEWYSEVSIKWSR